MSGNDFLNLSEPFKYSEVEQFLIYLSFFKYYTPDEESKNDPRISLIDANLEGLPPTTIINAEIDPLKAEGETLANKLKEAGVNVEHKLYSGVAHEFFGMAPLLEQAAEAQDYAANRLKETFKSDSAQR